MANISYLKFLIKPSVVNKPFLLSANLFREVQPRLRLRYKCVEIGDIFLDVPFEMRKIRKFYYKAK